MDVRVTGDSTESANLSDYPSMLANQLHKMHEIFEGLADENRKQLDEIAKLNEEKTALEDQINERNRTIHALQNDLTVRSAEASISDRELHVRFAQLSALCRTQERQLEMFRDSLMTTEAANPKCVICRETAPQMLLLPCLHVNMCHGCLSLQPIEQCPTCRAQVQTFLRVFIS